MQEGRESLHTHDHTDKRSRGLWGWEMAPCVPWSACERASNNHTSAQMEKFAAALDAPWHMDTYGSAHAEPTQGGTDALSCCQHTPALEPWMQWSLSDNPM